MFNFQGQEIFIIFVLALIVLGPERLPDAMRKLGGFVAEVRKMTGGFQQEFRAAVDEPMRQVRESVDLIRDQTDIRKWSTTDGVDSPPDQTTSAADAESVSELTDPATATVQDAPVEPDVHVPTSHIPTFDTPVDDEPPLIGDTAGFVVVPSRGTDLREALPASAKSPTRSVIGDATDGSAGSDLSTTPTSSTTDDVGVQSQLLRDFTSTRRMGPSE